MVGPFPLAKLGFLVVKQVSKPIASGFARRAKSSPFFRDYVCIPTAQLFHWYDVQIRMRILNLGKATSVPKLNEKKAIETGAQLLSELILFSIGVGILVFEYNRQSEKDEAKKEQQEREKAYLIDKVQNMEFALEHQSVEIKSLTRLTYKLQDDLYYSGAVGGIKKALKGAASTLSSSSSDQGEASTHSSSSNTPKETSSSRINPVESSSEEGAGLVTSAVNDLLGPDLNEQQEDSAIPRPASYQPEEDSVTIMVPGLVTEAVDYFFSGYPDSDHKNRRD